MTLYSASIFFPSTRYFYAFALVGFTLFLSMSVYHLVQKGKYLQILVPKSILGMNFSQGQTYPLTELERDEDLFSPFL